MMRMNQEMQRISKKEVRTAMKKNGKAVGTDDIPVEGFWERWQWSFWRVRESQRSREAVNWYQFSTISVIRRAEVSTEGKSHSMTLWERVVKVQLRRDVKIREQQYGFMWERALQVQCLL